MSSGKLKIIYEPIADPAPLGLAGFALTTFVLSAHNAGWAPNGAWIGLAFFYGGLAQLLAGMWEFKNKNVFGATAFSTYGAFWLSLGFYIVLLLADLIPGVKGDHYLTQSLGWYLLGFFIFNTYMLVCSTMCSKAVFVVFLLLDITLMFLFIGNFKNQRAGWTKAGGYFGIFTAAAAWYASAANVFNHTAKKAIIPLGTPLLSFAVEEEAKGEV